MKNLWQSYKQPTPNKWRKRGDWALIMAIVVLIVDYITPSISEIPGLNDGQRFWIAKLFGVVLIIYKFYTNTRKTGSVEPEQKVETQVPPVNL